jgi:hypothetical protein
MYIDVDGNVVSHDDPYAYIMAGFGIGCRIVDIYMRYPTFEAPIDSEWQSFECVTLSHDICCVEDVLEAVATAIGVDDKDLV